MKIFLVGVSWRILERDLQSLGVDTDAQVTVLEDGKKIKKPRFQCLTWGNETSISKHSYCSNIIFAGVLHRSCIDLAGEIVGAKDDLLANISNDLLAEVEQSEIAHCLNQGMSRGSCRKIRAGVASPMNVWLVHSKPTIQAIVGEVMPKAKWLAWLPSSVAKDKLTMSTAAAIRDHLETLPEDQMKITTRCCLSQ